jgi:Flp pilus assembly protein TadD
MFPKLTPLQWLVAVIGLFFYGFAVFALTRDYYLRHPPRPPAPQASPHAAAGADMAALGQRMRAALGGADAGAPAAVDISDPTALAREADRLFAARRFSDAVPLYRRLLELRPADVDARNDLGLALHYAGDSAAGLDVLRAGAAAAPEAQRIHLSLGFVALQAGDTDTARQALTRARALSPDSDVGREADRLLGLLAGQQDG